MKNQILTKGVCVFTVLLFLTFISSFASADEIDDRCKAEWGSDKEMVNYCTNNQRTAKREIAGYSGLIRTNCESEWGTDYEMVLYCIQNQSASQNVVQNLPQDEISAYCQNEWGTDYEMVEYCAKNQTAARQIVLAAPQDEITLRCTNEWNTDYVLFVKRVNKSGERIMRWWSIVFVINRFVYSIF
jgi:hypothetical protein